MARISGYQGAWEVFIDVNEIATDITSNTSTASWALGIRRTDGSSYAMYGTPTINIYISGQHVYSSSEYRGYPSVGPGGVGIASGTVSNIAHNADGTIVNNGVSFSWTGSGFSPNSISASGNYNVSTIPRKTDCPSLSGYVGSSYNLTLNKKSSSFTSALYITFGNINGWLQSDGSIGSNRYNFATSNPLITIPTNFYSQFSGTSAKGRMTLYTRSGNSDIGTDSKDLTVMANSIICTPVASGNAYDINSKTLNLTGNNKNVISQMSDVKVDFNIIRISDETDNRATITSIVLDSSINIPITNRTFTIKGATKTQYKLTITNSRGGILNTVINTNGELIPYTPLTIKSNFYRNEPTTGEVTAEYSGNYWTGVFGETVTGTGDDTKAALDNTFDNVILDTTLISTNKEVVKSENELTLTYQYRLQGYDTVWSEEYELTSYTINGTNFTYEGADLLINHEPSEESGHDNFDYAEAYEFRIHYKDKLIDGWTDTFLVARGIPVYWWSKDSVHIEGDLYIKDKLISNEEIYSTDEIVIGRWIDGKPLYRKVLEFHPTAGGEEITFPHNIPNVENVFINTNYTYLRRASGTKNYGIGNDGNDGYWFSARYVSADNKRIGFKIGNSLWSDSIIICTIEYTKTTD